MNVGSWFKDNSDVSNNKNNSSISINSKQEEYMNIAVEQLKSGKITENILGENAGPIKALSVSGNQIIYYGDDILVRLNFKRTSLTDGEHYYNATFSINENQFLGKIKLENMMYTEEWKKARVEDVEYDLVTKINKEYFE